MHRKETAAGCIMDSDKWVGKVAIDKDVEKGYSATIGVVFDIPGEALQLTAKAPGQKLCGTSLQTAIMRELARLKTE